MTSLMMTSPSPKRARIRAPRRAQRGVVLFIALIVLVAMTLAGIGMMRSVDTNNLIAGNLAFKNAAGSAGDAAIESARAWLTAKTPGQLETDQAGYFANWQPSFDPKTFDWAASSMMVGTDDNGNTIRYVAHRICKESAKSIDSTDCAKVSTVSVGSTKGGGSYGSSPLSGTSLVFYRITAKIEGPKFTVAYLQAFVY
jgi:type IV pilus assembly protein PilX